MEDKINSLVEMAQKIGNQPEYIQGGGGNVSVKLDRNTMAIKASGTRLSDMDSEKGFVLVDYAKIKDFYGWLNGDEDMFELNTRHDELLTESVLLQNTARPSIETGFHSFGDEYILHSHSVYANILNCSQEGDGIIDRLFGDALFVPYSAPGASLSLGIRNASGYDGYPSIVFLENHGIIISGGTAEETYLLHENVNDNIRKEFDIKDYPDINICKINEKNFISSSPYIKGCLQKQSEGEIRKFQTDILFPDQAVYGDQVAFEEGQGDGIHIGIDNGSIFYNNMSYGKALAFEETFASWLFIVEQIERKRMNLKLLSEEEVGFISKMESEKYRKKII